MEQIHVITPVTRLYNLEAIYKSMKFNAWHIQIDWWIVLDVAHLEDTEHAVIAPLYTERYIQDRTICVHYMIASDPSFIAGKGQINYALDFINKGWIYVIDDDTIMHPDFGKWFNVIRNMEP